jgi:TRAP-type mannitol/chloroaromatic compound transport system permease large subunit
MPYLVMVLIAMVLVYVFPPITYYLPDLVYGR